MRATFSAAARLHRPSEFATALKGKRVARGALFVVSMPREPNGLGRARLGLIIAKRHAPHAVTRNTIKRVIREAFRLRQHQLAAHDFVFRLQARVPVLSLRELKKLVRAEVEMHLERLSRP